MRDRSEIACKIERQPRDRQRNRQTDSETDSETDRDSQETDSETDRERLAPKEVLYPCDFPPCCQSHSRLYEALEC